MQNTLQIYHHVRICSKLTVITRPLTLACHNLECVVWKIARPQLIPYTRAMSAAVAELNGQRDRNCCGIVGVSCTKTIKQISELLIQILHVCKFALHSYKAIVFFVQWTYHSDKSRSFIRIT